MRKIIASEMITVDGYFAGKMGHSIGLFKRNPLETALICSRSPESLSSTGRCFSSACFPSSRCATRGSYSQGNTLKILTPHLQLLTP